MKEFEKVEKGYDRNLKHGKFLDTDRQFCIHPDMQDAYTEYDGTDRSFKKVFERREEAVEAGKKYWDDLHDQELTDRAREASQRPDFVWPLKRGEPKLQEQTNNLRRKVRKIWRR